VTVQTLPTECGGKESTEENAHEDARGIDQKTFTFTLIFHLGKTHSHRSIDQKTRYPYKTRRPFNNVILPVTGTVGDSHVPGVRHAGACCHEGPRIAFSKSLAGQILRLVRVLWSAAYANTWRPAEAKGPSRHPS
jgi:hypothetical protein